MYTVFGNQRQDEHFWEELCAKTTDSTTETSPSNNVVTTPEISAPPNDVVPTTEISAPNNVVTKNMKRNDRTLWIVSSAVITPLLMLPSHIIFILAAWLTDPPQATSIALVSIGIFLYFFLLFRQCYTINRNFKTECCFWSLFLPLYPIWAILMYAPKIAKSIICRCCCKDECCTSYEDEDEDLCSFCKYRSCKNFWKCEGKKKEQEPIPLLPVFARRNEVIRLKIENKKHFFNTKAFCIAYAWGWVLAGFLALFFTALIELPISVFYLPSYLLNIFQVLIVVISLLITYKIIISGVPAVLRFMKSARHAYYDKGAEGKNEDEEDEDEIEAGGLILGEVARLVKKKYE